MTEMPRRLSMKKVQDPPPRPWYRIENHVLDENNSNGEKAVIYIYDEIGDSWWGESTNASDFVKELSALKVSEIELHLNSPGGDIFEGVAIYQALVSHPASVHVVVDALAASAASFIAQAGDTVTMTQAATMMIHDGSGLVWGNAADMRSTADLLDKLSNTIAGIYSGRAGESDEFWRNLMIQETWFNAQEAVDAGLADEVGEKTKPQDDDAAKNKWNLSIFKNAGRANSPSPLEIRTRIANQFKEKAVTDTSGTEGTGTGSPDTDPELAEKSSGKGEVPPENAPNEGTPPGGQSDGDEGTEAAPTATPATTPTPAEAGEAGGNVNPSPANKSTGPHLTFTIKGETVQMTESEASARMTALQTFQDEAIVAGKKEFVKQLAADNKITGPQVDATETFALSLKGEQYDAWKATWEGASGVPMLGTQTGGTTNHEGSGSSDADAAMAEIERCEAIVRSFKQSNMKDEAIKGTPSYQTLMALKPDFKL